MAYPGFQAYVSVKGERGPLFLFFAMKLCALPDFYEVGISFFFLITSGINLVLSSHMTNPAEAISN